MGSYNFVNAVCEGTGLTYNGQLRVFTGNRSIYTMVLSGERGRVYELKFSLATRTGTMPDRATLKRAAKECHAVMGCSVKNHEVRFTIRSAITKKGICAKIIEAVQFLPGFLSANGFANCCSICGKMEETGCYNVAGSPVVICSDCYAGVEQSVIQKQINAAHKQENVVTGAVGALLGSVIGVAAILIISQMGYVAVISGIIMGVCSIRGYEILGGKLTKKGAAISILIMMLMIYFANRMDWAIIAAKELDDSLFTCFRFIPEMVKEGVIEKESFLLNLFELYAFSLVGAIPAVIRTMNNHKMEKTIGQLS